MVTISQISRHQLLPTCTAAAKSAIAMQEALRLAQPSKGDDRLSIRIVIGLGDIATLDGVLIGDAVPLVVRVETITPAHEIYLTSAAHLALTQVEVQTALVDSFLLQGFPQPITVYRIEQRHRTRVITDAYILFSDLRGFSRLIEAEPVAAVETGTSYPRHANVWSSARVWGDNSLQRR